MGTGSWPLAIKGFRLGGKQWVRLQEIQRQEEQQIAEGPGHSGCLAQQMQPNAASGDRQGRLEKATKEHTSRNRKKSFSKPSLDPVAKIGSWSNSARCKIVLPRCNWKLQKCTARPGWAWILKLLEKHGLATSTFPSRALPSSYTHKIRSPLTEQDTATAVPSGFYWISHA